MCRRNPYRNLQKEFLRLIIQKNVVRRNAVEGFWGPDPYIVVISFVSGSCNGLRWRNKIFFPWSPGYPFSSWLLPPGPGPTLPICGHLKCFICILMGRTAQAGGIGDRSAFLHAILAPTATADWPTWRHSASCRQFMRLCGLPPSASFCHLPPPCPCQSVIDMSAKDWARTWSHVRVIKLV